MSYVCRIIPRAFLTAYILALAALIVGTLGLFGQDRDPLSGVFLIPLGMPWNRLIELFPGVFWPWFAAAVPALNYLILRQVCLIFRRSQF